MKPFNRHVLIKPIEKEEPKKESLIVLPTDYKKPESPHQVAQFSQSKFHLNSPINVIF